MSSSAEKKFPIGLKMIKIINKQPEPNNKHKCLGQCDNCTRCSSNSDKKD